MSLPLNSRKRTFSKTWDEVSGVEIERKHNIKVIDVGRIPVQHFRKTKRITLVDENQFIGIHTGGNRGLLIIAEFDGMTTRSIAHTTPIAIVTGPETEVITPQSDITYNFFYLWEQVSKKDKDGNEVSKSMVFKGWIDADLGAVVDGSNVTFPLKLTLDMVFHHKDYYNEIQINKI